MKKNKIYNENCINGLKEYIPDNSIDLILTDPPYGINYKNNRRNKNGKIKTENGIINDEKNNLLFLNNVLKECVRVLKDGHHLYWFGRFDSISKQYNLFEKNNLIIKNVLIWNKNNHGTGDLIYSYAPKYECIIYAIKKETKKTKMYKLNKIGNITRHSDILNFKKISRNIMIHDHQKPTDLLEFLIEKSTNKNDVVLDPFLGSGATFYASNNINRYCIGFELDKDYYNLIKDRTKMENRFKIYTEKEELVGNEFAKLFNKKYIKLNNEDLTAIDGKINNTFIELQELKSKWFIEKQLLCIDTISVFYFKDKKRKKVSINDEDIIIKKLGKLFLLNEDNVYLIYIEKKNIKNISVYNEFLQSENYIFFPLNINKLKNKLTIKKFNVNNKDYLKDNWESAYTTISLNDIKSCLINDLN